MGVWVVRHGETAWSRDRQHTGKTDIPLTPQGREQAERLRGRLAGLPVAHVLTSPLSRARDTCALAGFADRAEVWPELVEWDYGELEGRTTDEFRAAHPGWSMWKDGPPGGETIEAVGARAAGVVARLASLEGESLVFAHGHFLRFLATQWIAAPPVLARAFALGPTAVGRLGFASGERAIELWYDEHHVVPDR